MNPFGIISAPEVRDLLATGEMIPIGVRLGLPPDRGDPSRIPLVAGRTCCMLPSVFVGRERELGDLGAALEGASAQRGSLFVVAGEPGIGKSRLAAEIAQRARSLGIQPAWGRCWEARGAPAFWPWIEAFEALGLDFPHAASVTGSSPAETRFALFREVTHALAQAAQPQPILLVLEDLHAADGSSLQLLELVGSQLSSMPVMIMGTYRDLEARLRDETREAIARIGRVGQLLQLPRLGPADVAALVRDVIAGADEPLVSSVFETTQGNPLFVTEMVRDLRVHGLHDRLPLGVREVIRERLSVASPALREVLHAGAVLGVEFTAADVARMIPGAPAQLDEARQLGLLSAHEGRMRFSHALYREALYHDLEQERRQTLHRAAAKALEAAGAPASALAHHHLEGGPPALARAVDFAIEAASLAVSEFAFEDAVALLDRAWASRAREHDPRTRCRLLIALGEAKVKSGDATGRQSCVEAAELARELGAADLLGRAGLAYGAAFMMGGVDPTLVGMLQEALDGLPDADSPLRARLMARLAASRQPSVPKDRPRDVALALEAVAMARRVSDRHERLGILHAASGAIYGTLHPLERLEVSREQERLAEELGDVTHLLLSRVRLALDHLELYDFASYEALADRYEALAGRVGPAAMPWRVPLMRSMIALSGDRFEESLEWQREAKNLGGEAPRFLRAAAFHRVGFLRAAERHAELRAALGELRGLWLAMPYGAALADARIASCLARVGDEAETRSVMQRIGPEAIDEEINTNPLTDALWLTADVALAGRLEPVARRLGDRSVMYWLDCEIVEAPNARSLAYIAAVRGRWDESREQFARALAQVERAGRRALATRLRFEMADLALRLGRRQDPSTIASAHRQADELGLVELAALIALRHPTIVRADAGAVSPPAFSMTREGEYYAILGSRGDTLRFKASRGMDLLAALIERPHRDVHVLDLVGASAADRGDAGELVDASARTAYQAQLAALRDSLELAEELGDGEGAERARQEMESIAAELRRSTGKRGRGRRATSAVDRARSAVQRRIKDAIDRIEAQDPARGAWLRRAVSTGNHCKFRPDG